tara:strand:+ start:1572 stop:2522 length:951 start_codon:yes stop_codon:yes gene_type:complete
MATYTTATAIGAKEDLSAVISRIDPAETPIYSNGAKETTKGVFHEWQVQELAAAVDTNHVNEGADYSYVNPTVTTRLGNYHQISVQAASVSGTLDAVDKAGRDKETAYVKVLKGIEQRRDIEKALFKNEARSASDARKAGKFLSYMTNLELISASTTPAGTGADVSDMAGTNAALTLAKIDSAMKKAYDDGGQPDMMVCSPANKVAFSDLSSGSAVTNQLHMTAGAPTEAIIIGSVSMYLTDFGTLNVTIDRQASNTEVFLLDSDYYSIGTLPGRNMAVSDIAATGDATKFSIVTEWTLILKAPKAHAAVVDLSTS